MVFVGSEGDQGNNCGVTGLGVNLGIGLGASVYLSFSVYNVRTTMSTCFQVQSSVCYLEWGQKDRECGFWHHSDSSWPETLSS